MCLVSLLYFGNQLYTIINCILYYPWLFEGLASLEAKRKFRAPKVTPKQQVSNGSFPSPQSQDTGNPDSVEDTRLPTDHIQASQCSSEFLCSEPSQDESINAASQCSSERFSCEFPLDDSANILPQWSSCDGGSDPPYKGMGIEDRKVFVTSHHFIIYTCPMLSYSYTLIAATFLSPSKLSCTIQVEADYCNDNTLPTSPCLVGNTSGLHSWFIIRSATMFRFIYLCKIKNILALIL